MWSQGWNNPAVWDQLGWWPRLRRLLAELRRRPRLVMPWLALGILSAATISAFCVGVGQSGFTFPGASSRCGSLLGFAGYVIKGPVTELDGRWNVPSLGAGDGSAATWIGVQSDTGGFIQVGTLEIRDDDQDLYEIFWSSTQRGYKAASLGFVEGSDTVSARMTRQPDGWELRVRDAGGIAPAPSYAGSQQLTTRHAEMLIPYDQDVHFNQSEWTQEDPGSSLRCSNVPYPQGIAGVAFSALHRDGKAPVLRRINRSGLLPPNAAPRVPSAEAHDSFKVEAAQGYGARYLNDIRPFDAAFSDLLDAGVTYSRYGIVQAVNNLLTAQGRLSSQLSSQSWPAAATGVVRRMETRAKEYHAALQAALVQFEQTTRWTAAAFLAADVRLAEQAGRLRKVLGLPPASPNQHLAKPTARSR